MKKKLLFPLLLALALALTACGSAGLPLEDVPNPDCDGEVLSARVLENDGGTLLLAGLAEPYTDLYTVALSDLEAAGAYTEDLRPGERADLVFDGSVLETWPTQPGNVTGAYVIDDGRDRLFQLYLDVLEDLWEKDPALRENITQIGFDLSGTRLTGAEQSGVEYLFARAHGSPEIVTGTWQELVDRGLIDGEDLYWPDGVFFSITEKNEADGAVVFDAQMWRSGLGACFLNDCGSKRLIGGDWEPYTVGSEAVS